MKDTKIAIIGGGSLIGRILAGEIADKEGKEVVFLPKQEADLFINGVGYIRKEEPTRRKSYAMNMAIATMLMYVPTTFSKQGSRRSDLKVDIVNEFELIQQKKSNLSRNGREWVVSQFNKVFKPIQNETHP